VRRPAGTSDVRAGWCRAAGGSPPGTGGRPPWGSGRPPTARRASTFRRQDGGADVGRQRPVPAAQCLPHMAQADRWRALRWRRRAALGTAPTRPEPAAIRRRSCACSRTTYLAARSGSRGRRRSSRRRRRWRGWSTAPAASAGEHLDGDVYRRAMEQERRVLVRVSVVLTSSCGSFHTVFRGTGSCRAELLLIPSRCLPSRAILLRRLSIVVVAGHLARRPADRAAGGRPAAGPGRAAALAALARLTSHDRPGAYPPGPGGQHLERASPSSGRRSGETLPYVVQGRPTAAVTAVG
jgi:hypothetical protein